MLTPLTNTGFPKSLAGSRWLVFMTVMAVYICMIDRIAISIAIIPMAEENGWSPTIQGGGHVRLFCGLCHLAGSRGLPV